MQNYKVTRTACYIGYIIQAITNNFIPLLFVSFNSDLGISLEKVTFISAFNFAVQLIVDIAAARFIDKIGYRTSIVSAQILSTVGFIMYGILPFALSDTFTGLIISSFFCALGSGLIEVLGSPIIESCPSDSKSGSMSFLHSFYSWGQAGVVLISTLFFNIFGIGNWRYMAILWATVPFVNIFLFSRAKISIPTGKEYNMNRRELISSGTFILILIIILCSGASELAMSQWASAFAEAGLNVSKPIGDIAGPCLFAILMGVARTMYSVLSKKLELIYCMLASSCLCVASYLAASLSDDPVISLIGCAVCGLSVGILWPGSLSLAAKFYPRGGSFMFGLLALAGDIGCVTATSMVGTVADICGGDLKSGLFAAGLFPAISVVSICILAIKRKRTRE